MMDRFLIAPLGDGQQTDLKPWLISDTAYSKLKNAYPFRGRIRKRFGSKVMNTSVDEGLRQLYTRLNTTITAIAPIACGSTDITGAAAGNPAYAYYFLGQTFTVGAETYTIVSLLPGAQPMFATMGAGTFDVTTGAFVIVGGPVSTDVYFNPFNSSTNALGNAVGVVPGATFSLGQMFSVGDEMYTVIDGTPGVHNMLATAGAGTFNITTGEFTITGSTASSPIYFYPSTPVMSFTTYETGAVNNNPLIAFDTQFAYQFSGGFWVRAGTAVWTGTDTNFYWGATWQGDQAYSNLLFIVNNNAADQIKYWDGAIWTSINPQVNAAGHTLESARILMTFKDRLIALNTIENDGGTRIHCNRARWCENGSPLDQAGGAAIVAWREDIPGRGGWIDAPTREIIVTAQILHDRLIVCFESSTWELVYTGNESLPFRWYNLNTELGAQSTFSQIPFDKVILSIGNVGICACNGNQVERIDDKIPQQVFYINNAQEGIRRVCGIRDYFNTMVYWSYPDVSRVQYDTYKYPNTVLVYNYLTASWATNDDNITAFGYYEQQDGNTWAQIGEQWQNVTDPWNTGQLATHPKLIIAGNQEGFTFIVDNDNPRNAPVLSIINMDPLTNIVTCVDHNLYNGDFVLVENCLGIVNLNGGIFQVNPIDKDTFTIILPPAYNPMVGVYLGAGTLTLVSRIDIQTKQYNFYSKQVRNASVSKVDFLVDYMSPTETKVDNPQIQVDCWPSYSDLSMIQDGIATGAALCSGILDLSPYYDTAGNIVFPIEDFQDQFWHPLYFQVEGESVQLRIYYNDTQMAVSSISLSDFVLNAMAIYAMPTTTRLQG